jgi:predicted methyltransferase
MRLSTVLVALVLIAQQGLAQDQMQSSAATRQAIQAALQNDIRSAADKARDTERKPLDVLSFFRLEQDMRVIEILPFGGWYTKILGPVLRESGMLYTVQPELGAYSDELNPVLEMPGMDRVVKLAWNGPPPQGRNLFTGSGAWDVEPVDVVLTFRNYHNFNYQDRMAINQSAFDALKPGGYYGVVDHTRRHMEAGNRENGRRVDPVLVIKEVQDSGFVFVDYSEVLRSAEDALQYEVGNPEVTGRTDRFTMLFMKPE